MTISARDAYKNYVSQVEYTLTETNVKKIIDRLINAGRQINHTIVWQIFSERWEGKPIKARSMTDVCEFFTSDIWNNGGVVK